MLILFGKYQARLVSQQQHSESVANGVADEVITLVKTVWSFGTYEREEAR